MRSHAPEVLLEGPAGTGKTRPILESIHALCIAFPKMRALILRKHAVTLTTTALVTFNDLVLNPAENVRFFGGSRFEPASYRYPNGSVIVVGGMDDASKVLSSEYDLIYVNEATELTLDDWETLTTRLRGMVLPHPRIIADCNPATAKHWLNLRAEEGTVKRFRSKLSDNPRYYSDEGVITAEGQAYLGTLQRLTGSRRIRLLLGEWMGVENAIYPFFDRELHVRPLPDDVYFVDGAFGADYGRVHKAAAVAVSVDQYGRRWVREAWGEPDDEHGAKVVRATAALRQKYQLRRGRVDPNADPLIGVFEARGITKVQLAERSRIARIRVVEHALSVFPGGRYVPFKQEIKSLAPNGPFLEPDSPGMLFVEGAPGIDDLCDQIEAYHYVHRETETYEDDVVARIDEDLVAAMEDAAEELETAPSPLPTGQGKARHSNRSQRQGKEYRRP